jgi:hypothetical protein
MRCGQPLRATFKSLMTAADTCFVAKGEGGLDSG